MVQVLGALIAVLVAAHLVLHLVPLPDFPGETMLRRFVQVNREASFATWFSSMLWMAAAMAAASIGVARGTARENGAYWWWSFALVPLAVSIDEVASVHEDLADKSMEALGLGGAVYSSWDIPVTLFALLLLAVFLRFYLRMPGWLRVHVAISTALALGSIAMEVVGATVGTTELLTTGKVYLISNTIEETFEMVSALVLVGALLRYLEVLGDDVLVRFAAAPDGGEDSASPPSRSAQAEASRGSGMD